MHLKIGKIAKMTGLSDSGIRFYEKAGIINPAPQENSNYREYSLQEVSVLMGCKWYRSCGFSLEETLQLINHANPEELSLQ